MKVRMEIENEVTGKLVNDEASFAMSLKVRDYMKSVLTLEVCKN